MNTKTSIQTLGLEHAKALVIKAFRKRWFAVHKKLKNQKLSVHEGVFEAPSTGWRANLARRFYAPSHIEKLMSMSDKQITHNHLPVIRSLIGKSFEESSSLVKELFSSQYLLFQLASDSAEEYVIDSDGREVDLRTEDLTLWYVNCYPAEVYYDDFYERVGGIHGTFVGVLMKCSGESFSKHEIKLAAKSVVSNVESNDCTELWSFSFNVDAESNQIFIVISDYFSPDYRDDLIRAVEGITSENYKKLVAHIQKGKDEEDSKNEEERERDCSVIRLLTEFANKDVRKLKKHVVLASLVRIIGYEDDMEVRDLEDEIHPYLFGGRDYFHSYGLVNSIVFFDQI